MSVMVKMSLAMNTKSKIDQKTTLFASTINFFSAVFSEGYIFFVKNNRLLKMYTSSDIELSFYFVL